MPNIGLNVVEKDTVASPLINPALQSNIGILFKSERGPINKPILVTSITQDRQVFGLARTTEFGAYVKRTLFNNAGSSGASVYGVRILGANNVIASVTPTCGGLLLTALAVGTAGNSITITVGTGTDANTKKITVQDLPSAATVIEIYDNITVDNLADAINRGVLLGGTSGGTGHVDGAKSTLISVSWSGDVLPTNAAATQMTGGGTTVKATMVLSPTATNSVLKAGYLGTDDPGAWGNSLYLTWTPTPGDEDARDLLIERLVSGSYLSVESWTGLKISDWYTKINDPSTGSQYIRVATIQNFPNGNLTRLNLTSGADGDATSITEFTGSQASKTGLYAFDSIDLQIITCADLIDPAFANILDTYAQAQGAVAVYTATYGASLATLGTTWSSLLLKSKSSLAMYRGWARVLDENGSYIWIPPVGHVIGGGYLRRMNNKGIYPNVPPAGLDISLNDLVELEVPSYNTADLNTLVHTYGFNPLMFVTGRGFVIRTSRTMSTDSRFYSVHIRRSLNFITDTLNQSLNWLEQEVNNPSTRARAVIVLSTFFADLYSAGMFDQTYGFNGSVAIKCDAQNNTAQIIAQRSMVIDIQLVFAEVAESITVNLMTSQQGLQTTVS